MTINNLLSPNLKVILIADDPRQRYALNDLLVTADVSVIYSVHSRQIEEKGYTENIIFLVDIAYGFPPELNNWVQRNDVSIVCNDRILDDISENERFRFANQLRQKIFSARHSSLINLKKEKACREVWILLASVGGPESITEFMRAMNSGLGIGFVYLQHINDGFDNNLLSMLKNVGKYTPYIVHDGDLIRGDKIAIISGSCQTSFMENGTFFVENMPWSGLYKPSGNTIIATLAKSRLPLGGAIVFSGMGDDGIIGAKMLSAKGGKIWVQSPSCCVVGAMPQKMLDEGLVAFEGTPQALADRLNNSVQIPKAFEF